MNMEIEELIEQCKKMGMPQSTIKDGVKVIIIPIEEPKNDEYVFGIDFGTPPSETLAQLYKINNDGIMSMESPLITENNAPTLKELLVKTFEVQSELIEIRRQLHIALYGGK